MSDPDRDTRWPRSVYGVGTEPDPRFSLANERTFLAWIRTGLGFLAGGMAIAALAHYAPGLSGEAHIAATLLIVAGVMAGVIAFRRWMQQERAMRLNQPLRSSYMMPVFSVVLAVVALFSVLLMR